MVNKKEIVTKLLGQHRKLETDLITIQEKIGIETIDAQFVSSNLVKFHKDLLEHLTLENDVFYKELLLEMENSGIDTSNTKEFIKQMHEIGTKVLAFLSTYEIPTNVISNGETFKKEFSVIVETLKLRIESEENGVYSYWL